MIRQPRAVFFIKDNGDVDTMPIYTFVDNTTGEELELVMKFDERTEYLLANPNITQTITSAPALGDAARLGVTKTPDSFNSLMKHIHRNNPGSKIETR